MPDNEEQARLVIRWPGGVRTEALDPRGTLLGRAPGCAVVLDDPQVSRRHARIYRDPFGRWIVEDLDSHNGIWVGGQRLANHALMPGQPVHLGPFVLSLQRRASRQVTADATLAHTSVHLDHGGAARQATLAGQTLSGGRLVRLNDIMDRLSELNSAEQLYAESCRCVAEEVGSFAVVVRARRQNNDTLKVQVLAHHAPGADTQSAPKDLRLSRTVMASLVTRGMPTMASHVPLSRRQLELTAGGTTPRAVYAVPVAEAEGAMDVLYLDMAAEGATASVLDFLAAVGRQVGYLRRVLLLAQEKAERSMLDEQLAMARRIQMGLTPRANVDSDSMDFDVFYRPAVWVGGDYCDLWHLDDGRLIFAVGDVSGKGISAAMVMSYLHAALRSTLNFCPQLERAIGYVNAQMQELFPGGTFVTMLLGMFDPTTDRLGYVNAGHILPVCRRPDGSTFELGQPTNLPLGVADLPFEAEEAVMEEGAALVVVTDGVTEAPGEDGTMFGPEGVLGAAAVPGRPGGGQIVRGVSEAVTDFRGTLPQQDDITVFALVNQPPGGSS